MRPRRFLSVGDIGVEFGLGIGFDFFLLRGSPVEEVVADFIGLKAVAANGKCFIDQYTGVLQLPGIDVNGNGDLAFFGVVLEYPGFDNLAVLQICRIGLHVIGLDIELCNSGEN